MKKWKTSIALSALFLSVSAHAELIDKRTLKAAPQPLAVHPSEAQGGSVEAETKPVNSDGAVVAQPLVVGKTDVTPGKKDLVSDKPVDAEAQLSKAGINEASGPVVKTKAMGEKQLETAGLTQESASRAGVSAVFEVKTHIKVNSAYLMEPVVGFGNGVPVAVALRQILPDMQLVGQSPSDKTTVNWSSKGTRMDALKSISSTNSDFSLVVDGSSNVVTMMGKAEAEEYAKTDLKRVWRVLVGDARVDRSIERWARDAGYSFRWDAERHILVSASSEFHGTIESAVNELLSTTGIRDSDYPLEACIYSNSPPLLRITRLGDQSNQCR